MLELDVSRTADGHLVVMHDWTVDRTTDGTGFLTTRSIAARSWCAAVRAVAEVRTRGARGAPVRTVIRVRPVTYTGT